MNKIVWLCILVCFFWMSNSFSQTVAPQVLPSKDCVVVVQDPIQSENDSSSIEVCREDSVVTVSSKTEQSHRHLLSIGFHVGTLLGWDVSYLNLDAEGNLRFRVGFLQDTNLQAVGYGLKFGYHPYRGRYSNKVFYGAEARYYQTPNQNGFMLGPVVGVSGGRKLISFRAAAGAAGYREGHSFGVAPLLDLGIQIRLIRFR
jgi:hypothetical protein